MSCIKCNLHKGEFTSENEFMKFEVLLENLVNSMQLEIFKKKTNSGFYEIGYQCKNCNAKWILSIPDQSYRGKWIEE